MKKVFQYSIYPLIMLSASFLLISGLEAGINYYLVTLPVITFFGASILLLERWMPYEKDWTVNKGDWNLDLTYYVINYSIKLTAQLIFIGLAAKIKFLSLFPISLPFWVQVLLALIIIDFFLFLVHWQSHKYLFLWRLHAIHHSSERLYFLNGEKRHALHQILEGGPGIMLCLVIGTPQPVVVAALAVLDINMFMQHTNLDYKSGVLKKLFCVAELHRWHHRADYKEAQVNYGAWLTIWDRVFGTAYDKPNMQTNLGAIGIKEEPNFPKSYWKQFVYPFSKKIQEKAKNAILFCVIIFTSFCADAQSASDKLLGNWQLQDGSMRISVYKEQEKYHGKIYWVKDPAKQKYINQLILWDLQFNPVKKEWENGKIQLPEMDHAADCFIKLKASNEVSVTGYHGFRFLGKEKKLTRI